MCWKWNIKLHTSLSCFIIHESTTGFKFRCQNHTAVSQSQTSIPNLACTLKRTRKMYLISDCYFPFGFTAVCSLLGYASSFFCLIYSVSLNCFVIIETWSVKAKTVFRHVIILCSSFCIKLVSTLSSFFSVCYVNSQSHQQSLACYLIQVVLHSVNILSTISAIFSRYVKQMCASQYVFWI